MIGAGVGGTFMEIFNASNPAEVNVPNFDNGKRFRAVIIPTDGGKRFHENTVVFNTTRSGSWMHEERTTMPFRYNKVYTLEFRSSYGQIEVLLNGVKFYDFAERLSFSQINRVEIDGDVHVHSAQFL
ncbi:galactoside-binding lectin [Teladorsagia circumcincta]|uniref:Galectin n=1 Tax=Teladorsagia circumcincta TaxID=45464 RepID=A0A2G9UXE2_TELCI|nr:galactoside-binding lectin [Teladorsagia circumcincta]